MIERETYYFDNFECVNISRPGIPGRTRKEYYKVNKEKMKEYKKKYREKNIDKIKEINKSYYEKNKEKILEKRKEYREIKKNK